jgi:hypothetical protein
VTGDDRRNMYGNSVKIAIRAYVSNQFDQTVKRLHSQLGIVDSQAAKDII